MRPTDAVTLDEAASILGCSTAIVRRHIEYGFFSMWGGDGLLRADVEQLATVAYEWRFNRYVQSPYWVVGRRAADTLGVSQSGLRLLADGDHVAYPRHSDGTRLYRRKQLQVMAQGWSPCYGRESHRRGSSRPRAVRRAVPPQSTSLG